MKGATLCTPGSVFGVSVRTGKGPLREEILCDQQWACPCREGRTAHLSAPNLIPVALSHFRMFLPNFLQYLLRRYTALSSAYEEQESATTGGLVGDLGVLGRCN